MFCEQVVKEMSLAAYFFTKYQLNLLDNQAKMMYNKYRN